MFSIYSYSGKVSHPHRQPDSQGCESIDVPSVVGDCEDTEDELEREQEFYTESLAWADSIELQ